MGSKKAKLAFGITAILFILAVVLSLLFSGGSVSGGGAVVLSEVMASNRTCPAPNGEFLDYIEVRNTSADSVDISGYMLADKPDAIGYTFPQGTVLPAGGYAVVWCDKNAQSPSYAAFGISGSGTDTLYLYNSASVVVDTFEVPLSDPNVPFIRTASGGWIKGSHPSPGFKNDESGYEAWLASRSAGDPDVVISEVLTGSACLAADSTGRVTDWVELWNRGDTEAVLTGGYLSDDPSDPIKWQIPNLTIAPGGRAVIRCAGTGTQAGEASFSLPRDGCTVTLSGSAGNTISSVEVPTLGRDVSWSLQADGTYAATLYATAGYENTDAGFDRWLTALGQSQTQVVITEICPANRSTVVSKAGALVDWIELYNPGSTDEVLTGYYLSADAGDRGQWQLPELVVKAGQRLVIPCSGTQAGEGEATFSISRDGCTVTLSGTLGQLVQAVELPAMDADRTYALQESTWAVSDQPTPGYANTEAGRADYLSTHKPRGALAISEVMPSNDRYFRQSDAKYYDWVELQNISSQPIDLADYCLSNDPDSPLLFALPMQILAPGERVILICSGNTELGGANPHVPFTLSRNESWLYVTGSDGQLSDCIRIYDVPSGGTVGRVEDRGGTFYFTEPTPGASNAAGVLFISATPTALTEAGIYNDVPSVSVELSGDDLRYTLDGSVPTANSTPYTGPIRLEKTTVVRFASFEGGKLPSDVVTAPYIINENHTLPVVSLSTEPDSLFGGAGLYVNYTTEREVPANVTLFDGDGGFSIDCGLKMFGHMGLTLPKKSFKINFRGKYGTDMLTYPVYGEDGPQVYDSLVIRSGQDYTNTIFRDELFTSLCRDASDSVLAQRDKHCILYINGEYWGIYTIKEAFGETMYAENYGVDDHTVSVQQAPVLPDSPMFDVIRYARTTDLSVQENYEVFASMVDVDSMIDWMIFQGYCSNTDIQQNLRYFKSTANGDKWQFAFYDLDWAWYFKNGFVGVTSTQKDWQHIPMCRSAMRNAQFREKFFTRAAELKSTVLSNENVLSRIDEYQTLLAPEIAREKARWGGSYEQWEKNVDKMRAYITERDHWAMLIDHFRRFSDMTEAERKKYFGG